MSKYKEGFQLAVSAARQIDIHWTDLRRAEMLGHAEASQERSHHESTFDQGEFSKGAGFVAGLKSRFTTPREDGHGWSPTPGGRCQICEDDL